MIGSPIGPERIDFLVVEEAQYNPTVRSSGTSPNASNAYSTPPPSAHSSFVATTSSSSNSKFNSDHVATAPEVVPEIWVCDTRPSWSLEPAWTSILAS